MSTEVTSRLASRFRARRSGRGGGLAGYTLVEVLVSSVLGTFVGMMFFSSVRTLAPRLDLQGSASGVTSLVVRARLEAIQRGVPAVLEFDLDDGRLRAFADVNGNSVAGSPGFQHYLKFDPFWKEGVYDPTLGAKRTDYEIGLVRLEKTTFGTADGAPALTGFTQVPGAAPGTPPVLVFRPDGVVEDIGALGLADTSGPGSSGRNHLEIAIANLTGKVEVSKYLHAEDSPTGSAGYFPEGRNDDGENRWVWY